MFYRSHALGLSLLVLLTPSVWSQDQWSWPEKPQNLQVLPKDWPGTRLRPVMTGFARSLGVRCSYCHTGEEGKPLSTYDFASDENPNKERAREMLRMLGSVNDHLKKIEPSSEKRVNMWCHTCHHGRPKPYTLAEELTETYRVDGVDSALATYHSLKKRYYGRGVYDFEDDRTLNELGYTVLDKDAAAAIKVFLLNTERFPSSGNTWDSLAEAYAKNGDKKNAIKFYTKALEVDPNNQNAKDRLKELRK